MATTALALLLACAAFIGYDYGSARRSIARQLSALAGVVGSQSAAALRIDDPATAHEILSAVAAEPHILNAGLYARDGLRVAAWSRPGSSSPGSPERPGEDGPAFAGGALDVFLPVLRDGDRVGTIHLRSDLDELRARLRTNVAIVLVILPASCLAAFLLSSRLEGRITGPILELASALRRVSDRKDFTIRARGPGAGEFAVLFHGFNDMISQIQARDAALGEARDELERRVQERTRELRRKEEQLLQSQKMEAVGSLAGGLAHDFNNLLSAVLGFGELALAQPSLDSRTRRFLEEIQSAGQEAVSLTRQLLAISRQQLLQPVLLDLNALVEELRPALARLAGDEIELEIRLDGSLPRVRADPAPMRQVLLHLVANAREAMPRGGRIRVETAGEILDEPRAWRNETVPAGLYARLSVADTGPGMPPEVQAHLFEPFFNARGRTLDRSTALGLSTVYGIVKQSGGSIVVRSGTEEGTEFSVFLPAEEERAPGKSTTVRIPLVPKTASTVLLVEDEAMIRRLAGEVLRGAGFEVVEASNGREALDLFVEDPERFDVVLTDVVMPLLGGRELAEKLARVRPDARVVFMSGYTDDIALHEEFRKRRIPLIPKPFTASALVGRIREVVDRIPPTRTGPP